MPQTYARRFRQAGNPPLADFSRRVDRRNVRVLEERLTDDVHRELLRLLDVVRRVLQAAIGERGDGH